MKNFRTDRQANTVGVDRLQEKARAPKENWLHWLDVVKDMDNWTLPGKKLKNWQQTEQDGVNVWLNATIWSMD